MFVFISPPYFPAFVLFDEQIMHFQGRKLKYPEKQKIQIKAPKLLLIFCCEVTFRGKHV